MSAIGGKMASLKRYRGRWSVKIRRKGHRGIYETFDKISEIGRASCRERV